MNTIKAIGITALATLSIVPTTSAHSWIEEYQVIGANGSYIGDRGYSRGYVARTDPGYSGFSMDYLLPAEGNRINSSDLLCHPAQRTSNYTNPAYPKLQVQPGGYVAMKYLENGHVTLPWTQRGKPNAGGTVFVYGTIKPSDTEKIADVLQWTSDGKGGDGRGFLMTAQNFDDGRCHQINCGNISTIRQIMFPDHVAGQPSSSVEQWCETDLQIPSSQATGPLTTYWIWQWPTAPNQDCTYPDGKDEYYTTCADFDVVGEGDAQLAAEPGTHTLAQDNPQTTAVSNFRSRGAYTTSPPIIMMEGTSTVGHVETASSAFLNQCSASSQSATADMAAEPSSCSPISDFTGAAYTSASAALVSLATTEPTTGQVAEATGAAAPANSAGMSAASTSGLSYTAASSTAMEPSTSTTAVVPSSTTVADVHDAGISVAFPTISTVSVASAARPLASYAVTQPEEVSDTMTITTASAPEASSSSTISDVQPTASVASSVAAPATSGSTTTFSVNEPEAPTVGASGIVMDAAVPADIGSSNSHAVGASGPRHVRRHARHFHAI